MTEDEKRGTLKMLLRNLHVLAHHGNHEVEKTNGFDEGETQNGVREELTTERGVAGNTLEESSENKANTDTFLPLLLVRKGVMLGSKGEN